MIALYDKVLGGPVFLDHGVDFRMQLYYLLVVVSDVKVIVIHCCCNICCKLTTHLLHE